MIEKYWPGMDTSETPMKEVFLQGKEKKAIVLWKGYLPMERGVSRLMWNSREEMSVEIISGKFSYDVNWILMALGHKAIAPGQEGVLMGLFKHGEETWPVMFLDITDTEIRNILDKKNYSSAWLEKVMLKLASIIIKVKNFKGIKSIEEDGTENWLEYDSVGPIVRIDIKTEYKKKRGRKGKNTEERLYRVYFTSAFGRAFLENLIREGYSIFPQQVAELPAVEQELLISTCGWKEAIVTPEKLDRLLHLKKIKTKQDKYARKKIRKRILGNLKSKGYFESAKLDKYGNYHLIRPEKYPKAQIAGDLNFVLPDLKNVLPERL
jgi:hypothetical protein